MTLWFEATNDARAEEVVEKVAELCDSEVGRPVTNQDQIPYMLVFEDPDDIPAEEWIRTHLLQSHVRAIVLPRALSEGDLQ